jgi:hypothetical protein
MKIGIAIKHSFVSLAALGFVTAFSSHASALTDADLAAHPARDQQAGYVLGEIGKKNSGYHDMVSDVDMSVRGTDNSETKRHFRIEVLERANAQDGDRSLLQFDSPADVKGTALLSHAQASGDDEQWLYLPSSKRVKRIALGNRGGAFLGSEFTYEDLTGADARKYNWVSDGTEKCGGSNCVKLEATPKDPSSSYSKRIVFVELGQTQIKKVDFYDRRGALLKTLTYEAYQQVGKFARATQWTMTNAQTKRVTVLHFANMKMNTGLTQSDLSATKLDQGN